MLDRKFDVSIPYTCFGTDITYVYFNYRRAYLSIIKDFCSGEIVAYKVSQNLDMRIVMDTMEIFKEGVSKSKDAMIHSDQGFHYTSPVYIEEVQSLEMTQSMSRKGLCIDNAPTESFFGHFKDEVEYKKCKSFEELESLISNYMLYYNTERKQWDRKKMTPVEYRDHLLNK